MIKHNHKNQEPFIMIDYKELKIDKNYKNLFVKLFILSLMELY